MTLWLSLQIKRHDRMDVENVHCDLEQHNDKKGYLRIIRRSVDEIISFVSLSHRWKEQRGGNSKPSLKITLSIR